MFDEFDLGDRSISLYRIMFSLYILIFVNVKSIETLGRIPETFYHPPYGPMLLFDGFPSPVVFSIITFLVYLGAFALLLGYRTKWASLLTGLSLAVGYGFLYSLGKINHNMLLILVPLVMAWSRWGSYYSVDRIQGRMPEKTNVDGLPVTFMAVCLGVALFIAGMAKILGGWLDPSLQAVQTHIVRNYYLNDRHALLAATFVNIDWPLFWEMADWSTVVLEVGLLLSVFKLSWFRGIISFLVFFHVGVLLVMNISFQHQLFVYALFVDWEGDLHVGGLLEGVMSPRETLGEGWRPPILIGALSGIYYYVGSPVSLINRVPVELGVSPTTLILMLSAAIFTAWKVSRRVSSSLS